MLHNQRVSVPMGTKSVSSGCKQASALKGPYICQRKHPKAYNARPRAATITVVSNEAKVLVPWQHVLDRVAFNLLLGPLEDLGDESLLRGDGPFLLMDIIKAQEEGHKRSSMLGKGKLLGFCDCRFNPNADQEEFVALLGRKRGGNKTGSNARDTKETYAMKCISKGMQQSILNEKSILMMTNSFFIIKLFVPRTARSVPADITKECFNGSQTLYFLLEAALGGELYATYNRKGLHGSEKHAKFYVAGTVCALAHMHDRRIIYRDLKPENLLLNEAGQLKLTDMGLAKFVVGKTFTTCGTPDYFAPELISSTGHTIAVDWWTLGILLFEFMAGHPPFESPTPVETYSKVMKGISKVKMPPKCQGAIGDLIKGLLKKEPSERLPMRPGAIQNVKDHKWYAGFNWEGMESQKLDAPYKPIVKSRSPAILRATAVSFFSGGEHDFRWS
ncbi:for [Symbiodinium natans]|uniref:non-specific serine/threonine protein kinase n=1 Tax=Symbiodinium natans TaxID=878477 RepID=A0A812L957_9DINO|nr:for [Symbiodinium natans]